MSLLNGNNRAVPDVPFYMSEALQEFMGAATGNISEAMLAAEVAVPGLVSQLGGLSASTGAFTITVGSAEGDTSPSDTFWRAYGFNDGSNSHSGYGDPNPFGVLDPLTITTGFETLTIVSIDGLWDGGDSGSTYTPKASIMCTGGIVDDSAYRMDISFPSGKTHGFLLNPDTSTSTRTNWVEIDPTVHPIFSETMEGYDGQTIELNIVISLITLQEAGDTGAYVYYLNPEDDAGVLYFIDPLQFDTTGEVKAFTDIAKRDATVPLFTQQVPKPPADYYPGTHAYVDGEWVPK